MFLVKIASKGTSLKGNEKVSKSLTEAQKFVYENPVAPDYEYTKMFSLTLIQWK